MTEIPTDTPLTRLNYFNGKFMRAEHLRGEQFYLRSLVHLSSLSGGHGVVYGFDLTLSADRAHIVIGPGLAISGQGRVLYFPATTTITISDLIERSQNAPVSPSNGEVFTTDIGNFEACAVDVVTGPDGQPSSGPLYVLQIGPVDAYCGTEDVFGKLCEDACVTSSERPFIIEGLLVKAEPLELTLPSTTAIAFTDTHLRSRVASAYYAREFEQGGHLISKSGLSQDTWCLGSRLTGGACVPIGVFSVNAGTATFLDPWIARRERIETPAKRYWAFKMRMRPWDIFLAQVLQFQCQLHDLLDPRNTPTLPAPCENERGVLSETRAWLERLQRALTENGPGNFPVSVTEIAEMGSRIEAVVGSEVLPATMTRVLIDGGIIELPAAGYLPIDLQSPDSVNRQVRRLLGEGVNLRFCTVRHDYVAHALEEAQHMDRISLLEGLVDPENKQDVDILVPDGLIVSQNGAVSGLGFRGAVDFNTDDSRLRLRGIARGERLLNGGAALYFGGASSFIRDREGNGPSDGPIGVPTDPARGPVRGPVYEAPGLSDGRGTLPGQVWFQLSADRNPLELAANSVFNINGRVVLGEAGPTIDTLDAFAQATVTIDSRSEDSPGVVSFTARLRISGGQSSVEAPGDETEDDSFAVRMTVEAEVDLAQSRATITFRPDRGKSNDRAELVITVSDAPMRINATLSVYGTNVDGVEEVDSSGRAALLEVDNVLAPGPRRTSAERALEALARKIDDPAAADAWKQDLFRVLEETPGELTMQAVRDWVLFHRRRRRVCEVEAPTPPVVLPPRRYDVFHIRTNVEYPTTTYVLGLIADLEAGDAAAGSVLFDLAGGRSIFPIEYAGGDDAILTSQATLLADYNAATPGNTLIAAVIASTGTEDGEALESSRGQALEDVIDGVSPAGSQIVRARLEDVPAAFSENDGFILLVTDQQQAAINTHAAYALLTNGNLPESEIVDFLNTNNFGRLFAIATPLSSMQFERGTKVLIDGSASPPLQDAWTDVMEASHQRVRIHGYAKRLPPEATDVDSYVIGQARTIDDGMKPTQVPSTAPAVAVLFGETEQFAEDVITFFVATERNIIFSTRPPAVRFMFRLDNALVGLDPVVRFDAPNQPNPGLIDQLARNIQSRPLSRITGWSYGLRNVDVNHRDRHKVLAEMLASRGVRHDSNLELDAGLWARAEVQPFESADITDVVILVFGQ